MIKFVATDLDGTLLNGERALPDGTFETVEQLHRKGILFCPASGRQYANLAKLFAPVRDKVIFICENGALVKYREETLFLLPIRERELSGALAAIRQTGWGIPMLCGVHSAYIESTEEPYRTYAYDAYTNCKTVATLDDVIGKEPICKIAVFDRTGRAESRYDELTERIPALNTVVSGDCWCDIADKKANKGAAIRMIQKKFSLAKEECVAFGDHMNDYEMLTACGNAYVTENGYPPLKARIGNTVPSNLDGGVLLYLDNLLRLSGDAP